MPAQLAQRSKHIVCVQEGVLRGEKNAMKFLPTVHALYAASSILFKSRAATYHLGLVFLKCSVSIPASEWK